MAELRPGWSRSTVVKLENGNRESVSVADWLALAQALDVPPVLMIADPSSQKLVPIAEGIELDPWLALLWLIGKQPLTDRPRGAWNDLALMLEQVFLYLSLVDRFHRLRHDLALEATDDAWDSDQAAERERNVLAQLAVPLGKLRDWSMPVPPVPSDVRKRAAELGIELPGQED